MKKQFLLLIFIGCSLVASYAQYDGEKRNLADVSETVSKTTITFRYLDDEPIVVDLLHITSYFSYFSNIVAHKKGDVKGVIRPRRKSANGRAS